jgi:hypothetical protein
MDKKKVSDLKKKLGASKESSKSKDKINLSNIYLTYPGGFGDDKDLLTTYFCAKKISQLALDLITFEDLFDLKDWPVSKILQREVSRKRVKIIANKFIKGKDKVKYFPPIIVALLPRDETDLLNKYITKDENKEYNSSLNKLIFDNSSVKELCSDDFQFYKDQEDISDAEGLIIKEMNIGDFTFDILCWDKSKYYAIIIDGQHRFESLKEAAKDKASDIDNYKQEVVFIDASKKYFDLYSKKDKIITPVKLFRKVFIDINRNPEPVSVSKQVIMDDMDTVSLFVQSLVNDEEYLEADFILPQIIDWHATAEKFELPYLTSIIQLKDILLNEFMDGASISSFKELKDKLSVRKWYEMLKTRFVIDEAIKNNNKNPDNIKVIPLSESFQEFNGDESDTDDGSVEKIEMFYFDSNILLIVQSQFQIIYRKGIVRFFNNYFPYKNAFDYYKSKNVFDKKEPIGKALIKTPDNRTEIEKSLIKTLKTESQNDLGAKYEILLLVVGQKAIFRCYFKHLIKNITNKSESGTLEVTDSYLLKSNKYFQFMFNHNIYLFGNSNSREKLGYKEYIKKRCKSACENYPSLADDFWQDFLYFGKVINYNSNGIKAISSVLDFLIENIDKNYEDIKPLPFTDLRKRMRKSLETRVEDGELDESDVEIETLINNGIDAKNKFLLEKILLKTPPKTAKNSRSKNKHNSK